MPISERIATELPATIKTTSYAVVDGDFGREIQFQSVSALTAQLPSVLEIENGFNVVIRNIGPGALLIQPVSPELIDGNPSASLATGAWVWIRGDGTEWKSLANNATGTGTVTQIDTSGGLTGGPITNTGIISIADDGVTLAKMAGGTAGNVISYDANGDPVAVATGNTGEVLTSNGAGAAPTFQAFAATGGLKSVQTFATNGTWTKPPGISNVLVWVIGGGGGGGNCNSTISGGDAPSGGGGAGASIKFIDVSAVSSEAVTIGSGGAGATSAGATGATGGTSSFGAHCSAGGGVGGGGGALNSGVGEPGAGGAGTGGDVNMTGGAGELGNQSNNTGGGGGGSFFGGATAATNNAAATPKTGNSGSAAGSGGAAGYQDGGAGSSNGGDGADGTVVVWEYA